MQIPLKRMLCHKRHFQLLELMVAAFILLICIAPTMRIYTSMYLSQQAIIRENQRDHLAHLVHAKFTEQLYKRLISLEEVMQSKPIVLSDPELEKLIHQCSYECEGIFSILDSKSAKGMDKPSKYLAQLVIKMRDVSSKPQKQIEDKKIENQNPAETFYDYFIYIDSGDLDSKEGQDDKKGNVSNGQGNKKTDTSNGKGNKGSDDNSPAAPLTPEDNKNKKIKTKAKI